MGDMDIRTVLQLEQFKNHVDHLSGRKSKATLISEFADCIASDTVTWEKFQLYYRALATCTIANEAVFSQSVCFLFAAQLSRAIHKLASFANVLKQATGVEHCALDTEGESCSAAHISTQRTVHRTSYIEQNQWKVGRSIKVL